MLACNRHMWTYRVYRYEYDMMVSLSRCRAGMSITGSTVWRPTTINGKIQQDSRYVLRIKMIEVEWNWLTLFEHISLLWRGQSRQVICNFLKSVLPANHFSQQHAHSYVKTTSQRPTLRWIFLRRPNTTQYEEMRNEAIRRPSTLIEIVLLEKTNETNPT